MSAGALGSRRPSWAHINGLSFCPICQEQVHDGTEDYDWGCGHCGYPDPRAVRDYEEQFDDE